MKINIFGDSYADRFAGPEIWWRVLSDQHGHEITCYGQGSSSIIFSARLIEQHHMEADFNIWCLTAPGRMSFKDSHGQHTHWTGSSFSRIFEDSNYEIQQQILACGSYFKYLHDENDENFLNKLMIEHHLKKTNVMVIPCFPLPLDTNFFLKQIAHMELQHYLPGISMIKFHEKYSDGRPGHLTSINHAILAEEINQNLAPGIFQTSLDKFQTPKERFEELFKRRS